MIVETDTDFYGAERRRRVIGCEYCHHPIHDLDTHAHLVTHAKGYRAHRLNFCDYDCVRRWLSNGRINMAEEHRRREQAKGVQYSILRPDGTWEPHPDNQPRAQDDAP